MPLPRNFDYISSGVNGRRPCAADLHKPSRSGEPLAHVILAALNSGIFSQFLKYAYESSLSRIDIVCSGKAKIGTPGNWKHHFHHL